MKGNKIVIAGLILLLVSSIAGYMFYSKYLADKETSETVDYSKSKIYEEQEIAVAETETTTVPEEEPKTIKKITKHPVYLEKLEKKDIPDYVFTEEKDIKYVETYQQAEEFEKPSQSKRVTSVSERIYKTSVKKKKRNDWDFSIGVGYPYVSLKYGNKTLAGEVRGAFGEGIQFYAARMYWYFLDKGYARLFTGLEGGYIKFDDVFGITGTGWDAGIFLGLETFMTKWFSISFDFAPVYINVESQGERVKGIEYVANFAVNIFPFGVKGSRFEKRTPPVYHPLKNTDRDLSSFSTKYNDTR